MIPLRLSVKNFMCYRDNVPTLDFESLHVACLCGENGHGKTALLDAITWALWGRARASQQYELIHQGQTDMEVTLDILVRDQIYRVIRKHTRRAGARQGATVLEFQASTGDGYRPVTADSVRETEALIVRTIQLDYETFINTAYLQQGKADQFTQNTASKRKEFLSEALGLSYYEQLEERAKSRAAELRDAVRDATERMRNRQPEIDLKPDYERRLESALAGIAGLTTERDDRLAEYEALRRTATELPLKRRQLPDMEARLANARREMVTLKRETRELRARLNADEVIAARADEIETSFATLVAARDEVERLQAAQALLAALRSRRAELKAKIEVQRAELETRRGQRQNNVNMFESEARNIPELEAGLEALRARTERLPEIEAAALSLAEDARAADAELARLNRALDRKSAIDSSVSELEGRVALEKQAFELRLDQVAHSVTNELEPAAARIPDIEERQRLNELAQRRLEADAERLEAMRGDERAAAMRVQSLVQVNKALHVEMEDTRHKFDLLEQGDSICPLCNQPVGDDGAEHLRAEYEAQGREARKRFDENEAERRTLEETSAELTARVRELETARQIEQRRVQSEATALARERDDAERSRAQIESESLEVERLRAVLTSGNYAHDQRRGIERLKREMHALDYDAGSRDAAQRRATNLHARGSRVAAELEAERQSLDTEGVRLRGELESAYAAEAGLLEARRSLDRLNATLAASDYAYDERTRLARVTAEIEALGYDAAAHQAQRDRATALEPYDDLHRQLREAQGRMEEERASLEERQGTLARRTAEAEDYEARVSETRRELATLPEIETKLRESERRLRELEGRLRDFEVQRAIQQERIAHCAALEAQTRADEAARRELVDEKSIYDELAVAFGKNGIPALIIENAIPQLQSDANRLLSRLTETRMSLKLELREGRRLRGSDVRAEELDILISDEIGTRSYEMFSGGEAFRIDFALRIALSRLLASRSGAPLPILFIDEGFGSQDASGQDRLTEAIKSIEDDFQKIIVITHVDQIKEAFPVRIEVTKDEYGATFSIV